MRPTIDTPHARIAHDYLDYATIEAATREYDVRRYPIVAGVARGEVRALRIAGGRILVHRGDVAQLARDRAQRESTQTHADTRPAA